MGQFSDKVFEMVKRIPAGKVASYGDIARLIGQPRKSRFVGFALRKNPDPWREGAGIPCHRVVFQDGRLAESYVFGGIGVQRELLENESVVFDDEGKVDMSCCRWNGWSNEDGEGQRLGPPADFDWKRELGEEPTGSSP